MHGRLKPEGISRNRGRRLVQGRRMQAVLDELPVPIYTTDADGARHLLEPRLCRVRRPRAEARRGPMVRDLADLHHHRRAACRTTNARWPRRSARSARSATRSPSPSGRTAAGRASRPYPTPLFDADGTLTGAVNMLIDVSDEQADVLAEQAERCRRLADATYDRETCSVLGAWPTASQDRRRRLAPSARSTRA